jgi:hypothetical protein
MKKRIYLLLLSVIVIFSSCKDDSGIFVEQLFTDSEISIALRDCLRLASDSTRKTLCVVDTLGEDYGYFYYDSGSYRIDFPPAAKQITDTLIKYGYGKMLDSLIYNINYAADLCGTKLKDQFLDTTIKALEFPNPKLILHGGENAATRFYKEKNQSVMFSVLENNIFLEQVNKLNIIQTWNDLQIAYFQITENYSSVDIITPSIQQMMDGFFKMMALVEEAIRKNPELRGKSDSLLNKVFETQ